MQIPHASEGRECPLHKKDMSKVCHKCPWWTQLRGKHPQSGQDVDEWLCAISALPMLMFETSRQARSTTAAVETFRNEMVNANEKNNLVNALIAAGNMQRDMTSVAKITSD